MIGMVFAMECEAEGFINLCKVVSEKVWGGQKCYELSFDGKQFSLIVCGIGKVNAAAATVKLIEGGATQIFNAGLCGAISDNLSVGEVVSVSQCIQYDFDLSNLDHCKKGKIPNMESEFFNLSTLDGFDFGVCASGDRFSNSEKDKKMLSKMGADIREMELAAVAQVCELYNIPLFSVKSVSNVTGKQSSTSYAKNKDFALSRLFEIAPKILEVLTWKK